MKKCVIFFVVLVAMLVLAVITGYNDPNMMENTVVMETPQSNMLDFENP
ncbi:MAG: hypothetical protein OER83_01250 [Flavobacteriaceae bacterium]|nr:hypothetical protein [Flavobacteriaceae bacterium]